MLCFVCMHVMYVLQTDNLRMQELDLCLKIALEGFCAFSLHLKALRTLIVWVVDEWVPPIFFCIFVLFFLGWVGGLFSSLDLQSVMDWMGFNIYRCIGEQIGMQLVDGRF